MHEYGTVTLDVPLPEVPFSTDPATPMQRLTIPHTKTHGSVSPVASVRSLNENESSSGKNAFEQSLNNAKSKFDNCLQQSSTNTSDAKSKFDSFLQGGTGKPDVTKSTKVTASHVGHILHKQTEIHHTSATKIQVSQVACQTGGVSTYFTIVWSMTYKNPSVRMSKRRIARFR